MSGTPDNRLEHRAPVELRVEYRQMNMFFADYTKNISKGGTFLKTSTPLAVGTRFVFLLGIPGFAAPIELQGEVTWVLDAVAAASAGQDAGMGIRFVFEDEARRTAFERAVEKLMLDHLGPEIYRSLLGRPPASRRG